MSRRYLSSLTLVVVATTCHSFSSVRRFDRIARTQQVRPFATRSLSLHGDSSIDCGIPSASSRRWFLDRIGTGMICTAGAAIMAVPTRAGAASSTGVQASSPEALIADLREVREKLTPVPDLLRAEEWEKVRTILKTPPVNTLWNLGDGKNTLLNLAKLTDEYELIELKDELQISLQMCDQLTYDNVFVYFQPGSGKVKVKEPTDLALKAISQLDEAIRMASEGGE